MIGIANVEKENGCVALPYSAVLICSSSEVH